MRIKVSVSAVGHGMGYNRYYCDFEFFMLVEENYLDDDREQDRISARVRREAQRKTTCDHVTIRKFDTTPA